MVDHVTPPEELQRRREQLRQIDEEERRKKAGNGHDKSPPPPPIAIYDAGDIDISQIPPRGWLLGGSFCRKFISGLVSEGGGGKTATRYAQYLALASGRNLTGEHVHIRSRVLIACFEDDLDEVKRRIAAAMLQHNVSPEDVKGWLYFCTPKGLRLLQVGTRGDHVTTGPLSGELRESVELYGIDLLSIDPFVKAHGVSENDNNMIDQVCTLLADLRLSAECNIGIDLISHARKGTSEPGDADRDRGASSKRDAGRLMRTLIGMTKEEAELFDINEKGRREFIRIDDAKVNITRRSSDAMWFQLVGVSLGNRNDLYPNGDEVQSVTRWYPPDVFNKLDVETSNRILDKSKPGHTKTADTAQHLTQKTAQLGQSFRNSIRKLTKNKPNTSSQPGSKMACSSNMTTKTQKTVTSIPDCSLAAGQEPHGTANVDTSKPGKRRTLSGIITPNNARQSLRE